MPTVHDIRIDFEITQPRLLLNAVDGVNPTDYAYIVFSQWYKGDPGRDGNDGRDGTDGADGFSPVVTVTPTEDGHEVTITDAGGDHTFDVNDGVGIPQTLSLDGNELTLSDGGGTVTLPDGLPSQTGNAGKFLTTDGEDAIWAEIPEGDFVCTFTTTQIGEEQSQVSCNKSVAEIVAAYQSGQNVRGIVRDAEASGSFSVELFVGVAEDNSVIFQNTVVVFGAHLIIIEGYFNGSTDEWRLVSLTYSNVAFSGDYQDLENKPTLGTASELDVAESGNATSSQVVKGDDSRLSDARTPTSHTHTTSDITDFPTIPDAVSGTNDGTNWTTITIGSTTKAIPQGGGLSDHDFTHTANTTVSTSTATVTFAANTRGSAMLTISDDLGLTIACNNGSDNYIWIKNTGSSEVDITISGVTKNSTNVSNVYVPSDGITVPAGGLCEIGIIVNTDGAFITSRNDLAL